VMVEDENYGERVSPEDAGDDNENDDDEEEDSYTPGSRGAPQMFPRKLFQILSEANPRVVRSVRLWRHSRQLHSTALEPLPDCME
jgi:hypothetical protein